MNTDKQQTTTAHIVYVDPKDESVKSAYVHYDGYPQWTYGTLKRFYKDNKAVNRLISGGRYGYHVIRPNFSDCDPYHDQTDETNRIKTKSLGQYFTKIKSLHVKPKYVYVFKDGKWSGYRISKDGSNTKLTQSQLKALVA